MNLLLILCNEMTIFFKPSNNIYEYKFIILLI